MDQWDNHERDLTTAGKGNKAADVGQVDNQRLGLHWDAEANAEVALSEYWRVAGEGALWHFTNGYHLPKDAWYRGGLILKQFVEVHFDTNAKQILTWGPTYIKKNQQNPWKRRTLRE